MVGVTVASTIQFRLEVGLPVQSSSCQAGRNTGEPCKCQPVSRMGNLHSTPNKGRIWMRYAKLQANRFDGEFGEARENVSVVSILIKPFRQIRRIPLAQCLSLFCLSG
jgi:hypothetical protein